MNKRTLSKRELKRTKGGVTPIAAIPAVGVLTVPGVVVLVVGVVVVGGASVAGGYVANEAIKSTTQKDPECEK